MALKYFGTDHKSAMEYLEQLARDDGAPKGKEKEHIIAWQKQQRKNRERAIKALKDIGLIPPKPH